MPAVSEHHVRVTNPNKYDRFTRKQIAPGISQVYGWKDNKSEVQAYRFKADKFTVDQAKKWMKDHDKSYIRFDVASEIKKLEIDPDELEMGIRVEEEHKDTIKQIIEDTKSGKIKPLEEYYKMIAIDHFKEEDANPNYYTDLLTDVEDKPEEVIKYDEILKTIFSKDSSSIKDITPELLRSLDNNELKKIGDRLHGLFERARANRRNVSSYIMAANWMMEEAAKRGLDVNTESELYKVAMGIDESMDNVPSIELPELPLEVVVVKDLISIVGSVAKGKENPGDIDILIRADMGQDSKYLINSENINVPVRKIVDANKDKPVHYFSSTQGPHDDHIPLYDLVLRRKEIIKTEIIKQDEESDQLCNIFKAMIDYDIAENHDGDINWEKTSKYQLPVSGKGKFIYHHHYPNLSEEDSKLTEEELKAKGKRYHGDLRFEGNGDVWGFNVFLNGESKDVCQLGVDDRLQGSFKLPQEALWLDAAIAKPLVKSNDEEDTFNKFFTTDAGNYSVEMDEFGIVNLSIKGKKINGNYSIKKENSSYSIIKKESGLAAIYKSDKAKQIVYAVVIEPMTDVTKYGDAHGDRMTADEIEKTAHLYLEKFRNVDVNHSFNPISAVPVESYISPVDFKAPDGTKIKKGSWILAVKVNDASVWDKIERGELNAYSPGGWGYKKDLIKKCS